MFSTAEDNQSAVTIRVFQGEREMAADNKMLGQFRPGRHSTQRRGLPQIEVTFDIDANGIVNVSAKDKATGKEQQVRIQASGGLSDDDIERMVQEAEANADSDKKRRELVDARNSADSMAHSAEKSLEEYGDKIDAAEKTAIETAIQELKDVKDGDDLEAITAKTEALSQASMKLGEAMYKAQQEEEAATGGGGGPEADAGASKKMMTKPLSTPTSKKSIRIKIRKAAKAAGRDGQWALIRCPHRPDRFGGF